MIDEIDVFLARQHCICKHVHLSMKMTDILQSSTCPQSSIVSYGIEQLVTRRTSVKQSLQQLMKAQAQSDHVT